MIYLGAYNLRKQNEAGRMTFHPKEIIIHPGWNPSVTNYDGDISVLILEDDVHFNSYISPICLSWSNEISKESRGTVAGYGAIEGQPKTYTNIPRKLDLPIYKKDKCTEDEPLLAFISSPRTFCAGSGHGDGVCIGDSGNGLFVIKDNLFYLRGIVSSSLVYNGVCETYKYAVFTDVLKYKDWIENPSEEISVKSSITSLPLGYCSLTVSNNFSSPNFASNYIREGQCLLAGQEILSSNRCFKLQLQTDGNLVIYRRDNLGVLWNSYSERTNADRFCVHSNALVLCKRENILWKVDQYLGTTFQLMLSNDGNLLAYEITLNHVQWATQNKDISYLSKQCS